MERYRYRTERISLLLIGGTFVAIGMGFAVLGLTWLPVIGLLAGLAFLAMAYYVWLVLPSTREVKVKIGSHQTAEAGAGTDSGARRIIPVTLLSGTMQGFDFDARTVDLSTVRFGPGLARPIEQGERPSYAHRPGADGGRPDLILHFSLDEAGITEKDIQSCLVAETTQGEAIRGCDTLPRQVFP